MDIDITSFVNEEDPSEYSASQMELGQDAGKITWTNAMRKAGYRRPPLLRTKAQFNAFRDHVREFGAWDVAEISGWSATECNALLIQMISGDMREMPTDDDGEIDWAEVAIQSKAGRLSGNMFKCDVKGHKSFGHIFYYLGS